VLADLLESLALFVARLGLAAALVELERRMVCTVA
jgi:hypothetical protein